MKVTFALIASAILVSAFMLPSLAPARQAEAATANHMLASFIGETGTAKDLKYIEYQTKTTKSNPYNGVVTCQDPPNIPGWCNLRYTDLYVISGVGSDNRWYQCGVHYLVSTQKWVLDWEVFSTSGQLSHVHFSTIPKDTIVNIKLGVESYTGSSGVSCVISWSGGSASYTDTARHPSYFKRTPSPINDWHTSVMSEYSTTNNLTPSTLGTVTYTKIKLVDTSGTTTSVTKVKMLISDTVNSPQYSSLLSLTQDRSFTYSGYKVTTYTTGKVTTT